MNADKVESSGKRRGESRGAMVTAIVGLLTAAAALGGVASTPTPVGVRVSSAATNWAEIDRLVKDQKLEAAVTVAERALAQARTAGQDADIARALVTLTQLRIGLHGYETAVRDLRASAWPTAPLPHTIVALYYGHALTLYAEEYAWEIDQREQVAVPTSEVDLRAWTRTQIWGEALRAYADAWRLRRALGDLGVGVFAPFVERNTFPPGIRDTARDTVSYLLVAALSDTAAWSSGQENDVYRLDLDTLLADEPPQAAPDDSAAHPLVRIAAVLADLAAWHLSAQRHEAALEARLELIRRLADHCDLDTDLRRLRADLERRLPAFRAWPWWSTGMAELAELEERAEANDALLHARDTAWRGEAGFPGSLGGQRCRSIAARLVAPSLQIRSMQADGAGKRSIEVTHANLDRLFFRAYRVDLAKDLASGRTGRLVSDQPATRELLRSGRPVARWTVALPPTPDLRVHRTYVTPPFTAIGGYVIVASTREDFGADGNRILTTGMVVTNLVVISRVTGKGGLEVRVVSGPDGTPVSGAEVTLLRAARDAATSEPTRAHTDEAGLARFSAEIFRAVADVVVAARRGGDVAVDPTSVWVSRAEPPRRVSTALVFTDRSVYRPLQKIQWKVVAYEGDSGTERRWVSPGQTVTVSLVDPNGQYVEAKTTVTNTFGSAAGEFIVPSGRPLGSWRLTTSNGGWQHVLVEEYKRPTFEAAIADPATALRLNALATVVGSARYYFGLPVTGGAVRWQVRRVPELPRWWAWRPRMKTAAGAQMVAFGSTRLDGDGSFSITFTPAADERLAVAGREVTYRYEVTADVTDEGGETRSARRVFRVGFATIAGEIETSVGFLRAGAQAEVTIVRRSLDGEARSGAASWVLETLAQPATVLLPAEEPVDEEALGAQALTPGDRLRPRWERGGGAERTLRCWPAKGEVASGSLQHDAAGKASVRLGPLSSGAYRLSWRSPDEFGATAETRQELIVVGDHVSLAVPAILRLESGTVAVGGTATVLVHSGVPGQTLYLERYRAGRLAERRLLKAGSDPDLVSIPVTEQDRGGFTLTLTVVRDHQLVVESTSVWVPWDDRELKLEFATFRDVLRPGQRETWRVVVRDSAGRPAEAGAAELLAYMYDRSLDVFAPHDPPSFTTLLPDHRGSPGLSTNLGANTAQVLGPGDFSPPPTYPELEPDRLDFFEDHAIGGPGDRRRRMKGEFLAQGVAVAPAPAQAEPNREGDAPVEEVSVHAEPAPPPGPSEPVLRSNFAETAFWQPQLLIGADGSTVIEFAVPDSVTAWNVWVHAFTRDLRSGSLHRETRSVRELMVRPYLPRFLREGDRAAIRTVVNNASAHRLVGSVRLEVTDPTTGDDLGPSFGLPEGSASRQFVAEPGNGTAVEFELVAPVRVGAAAIRVTATAGGVSDGELRLLPVLPGRMHLAQSRFVALRGDESRRLRFEDLARTDDPTRVNEQLVVTVDAQLFAAALQALPYLVTYPYECTEQTLNRFVSTGLLASLYGRYPAVERLAEQLSARTTPFEAMATVDPNRSLALEETPWLVEARGGEGSAGDLANVLDARVAVAVRDRALAKLRKAQTADGAFPWWPGGPPSPYMTLYILQGLGRAASRGVEVPKEVVQRAWIYLAARYRDEWRSTIKRDCCWELLTQLNFVATAYPDPSWTEGGLSAAERREILDFSYRHWRDHSPYLKGYLALTLQRSGRAEDARLVWASVMDSARTTPDAGTSWAPEERSWLWYNDTIETHAFALETLLEIDPTDPRRHGLVQWLMLNRKLNQWKSTRATAEVLHALVAYLERERALDAREDVSVDVGRQRTTFTFDPERFTGSRNQVVVSGDKVEPATCSTLTVEKHGPGLAFASATWHYSTERLPEAGRGDFFAVERRYYRRVASGGGLTLEPLEEGATVAVGDQLEVQLTLRSKQAAEYVHLRDPRAAGLEPESVTSGYRWDLGIGRYEETRDSGSNFFFEQLPAGEYTLRYRLRAATAGTFRVAPATVQSMYAPEFNAFSAGTQMRIVAGR